MATISIVMPVYNGKEYLKESINSILDQTYTDWEFLIINEHGSNDGSKEIIEEYSKVDSRIILIQNEERLGISASMNVGIDRASGKYIARMDADDISMPKRFQKQVEFMENNPDIGMCGVEVEIFGSNSFEWGLETDRNKLATNILFYSPSVHPTVMIRKEILDKYNLRYNEDYRASEDYELFAKICSVTSVANINEVLFRYRIMENNATFKNNDIGIVLYSEVMNNQFEKMGLKFTEEEIQLLSPHYSMKQSEGGEVLERLIKLDLLLKKILVANEKCNLYNRKYLSNTLHKRFKEAYDSVNWECKNYDRKKLDEIYDKSIFKNEFFYEKKEKINNITPLITVLMPTFNSEKYVADTIWSVLNQTFGDFEFLIVNEFGSNDDTIQIIKMFDDSRIKVIQNTERLGLAESLNLGIREARGKYIARIDADDLCDKERLKLQVEFLNNNDEYGVCGSWQHHFGIDTDYIHKVPTSHEDLKAQFIYNCELCHSTLMLRRDYFINNNLFFNKNAAAEDYELWTRAIYKFKFANIPRVLGEYRIGEDNITAKKMERLSQESAELAVKNIKEHLNVDVPKEHKKYMTGWVNEFDNISDKNKYKEVLNTEKRILKEMWNSNNKMNSYNPESLLKVIARRWFRCSNINGVDYNSIANINDVFNKNIVEELEIRNSVVQKGSLIKRVVKKGLKVFYNPIKRKILDKFQQQLWDMDGHISDVDGHISDVNGHISDVDRHINDIDDHIYAEFRNIEDILKRSQVELEDKLAKLNSELVEKIIESEKRINQVTDTRIWKAELAISDVIENHNEVINKFNLEQQQRIILINTPEHSNLGDHAIAISEIKFLKDNFKNQIVELSGAFYRKNKEIIRKYISENDLLAITGGGFLGNLWQYEEDLVRDVIRTYNNNSIIILPQTIYYSDDNDGLKELEISKSIYSQHDKLTICARDKASYEILIRNFKNNKILLMPDMVLYNGEKSSDAPRHGILVCLKNDKESILKDEDKRFIKDISEKFSEKVTFTDTVIDFDVSTNERKKYLNLKLEEFKRSKLVITDRLHGMIFSTITGTPCIAIDSCNYKIRSNYEWFEKLEYIKYAYDLENAEKILEEFYDNNEKYKYDKEIFDVYFQRLVNEINQIIISSKNSL